MATKNIKPPKSIGRQLNFTTGRMNALCAKMLEPHGLSLPQWVILSCLWREGEMTISQLADLLGTQMPATSRIIDRMIERDLIARRKLETDARVTIVSLSDKGKALDHLADFFVQVNEVLMEGLTETERETAFKLLKKMDESATKRLT